MAPLHDTDKQHFAIIAADQIASEPKTGLPLHEQPRKSVSFAPMVSTLGIIHINDYSSEEVSSTWYSRDELRAIKSEAKCVANSSDPSTDDICLRGLEARTAAGARRKRQNRIEARSAVFFEQDAQEEDGYSDPDAIADAYFECSERCQAEAQMIAVRDQREAMEAYKSLKLIDIAAFQCRIVVLPTITGSAAA